MDAENRRKNRIIYCHFSFKRPKGHEYGLFAVAFYSDFEGKQLIMHTTRKYSLWENHQFITAVQSYEVALRVIFENQGKMRTAGINQIMLVTDNSTLAGWIINPKKNKKYYKFMEQAVSAYRSGSHKEIVLGIGLCEPRKAEKSYKYCQEELVDNEYRPVTQAGGDTSSPSGYKIDIGENYSSVLDILNEDKSIPTIKGIKIL